MAEGAAPRRIRPRPQRAAHGDAGTRPPEVRRRGIRFPALPSRLLSVFAVLPAADPVCDHPAWQAGPARAPTGVHDIFIDPGGFNIERAAASGAASQLDPYNPPRPAGEAADAATVPARIPRGARPDRAGKGSGSGDQD